MKDASENGLVIANLGASLLIENAKSQIFKCRIPHKRDLIVSGDRVRWTALDDSAGVIDSVLPRVSELTRVIKQGKTKALVANIDQLVIVSSIKPVFDIRLIDTYLVVAENMKVSSLVVFNKADLFDADDLSKIQSPLTLYNEIGYKTLLTSKNSLSDLQDALTDRTSIFVGQSGVGKSTLVKSLIPDVDIKIGALSKASEQGSHTTTITMLYHLTKGGKLIDSPGVREFIPEKLSKLSVREGFIEFLKYRDNCRFRDCTHITEPNCAVLQALTEQKIKQSRYDSYLYLFQASQ